MRLIQPRSSRSERLFQRKRFFLFRQRSPRTGYIQRRFPASSFWYAQFTAFCSPFQAKSIIFKTSRTSSAPPHLRVRFSGGLRNPTRLIVSVPFPPAPLQGTEGKGYLTIFFFMRFVFRGLKPTARNIQPLTRLLRKRNYVSFAHFVTAFHFFANFAFVAA